MNSPCWICSINFEVWEATWGQYRRRDVSGGTDHWAGAADELGRLTEERLTEELAGRKQAEQCREQKISVRRHNTEVLLGR